MMSYKTALAAAALVLSFGVGSATAQQAPAPAPATPAPATTTKTPDANTLPSATVVAKCAAEADKQGLQGDARGAFTTECEAKAGKQ